MNRPVLTSVLLLLLLPLILLSFPSTSHAAFELGAGFGITFFEEDLDSVDAGAGFSAEANIGTGAIRLMLGVQSSDHDPGDYRASMVGPSWTLDLERFSSRIYALLSSHDFETYDGYGLTLGGGLEWPVLSGSTLGFDFHLSQWEGDGLDVRTGTLQVLFKIGF
jgi:hypothetical protein